MPTNELYFFVAGVPVPQGSTRAFVSKGRPIITHSNRNLKDWRQRIATEAQKLGAPCRDGPLMIHMEFAMPRPKSLPKKVHRHIKKPDLDKLVRAVLDGVTGILIKDDSQVFALNATKHYQSNTGVHITLIYDGD